MSEKKIFTAAEFAGRCASLAREYNTVYALGMWGWRLDREGIDRKAAQYPSFYSEKKKAELYALAKKGEYWGFDCVCMIKALLWGWDGDPASKRGGAKYASNGVPDFGADAIGKYCDGFTADFDGIGVGEVLWTPGHVGVYVGGGLAVECTAKWEAKVLITAVGNLGTVAGYHTRTWHKHGRLKWIDYTEEDKPMTKEEREDFDRLKETVERQEKLLKIYRYWSQIEKELPWAYPPLRALYNAGLFAGSGPGDLNVCRVKIECLVCLAAALKKQGVIDY